MNDAIRAELETLRRKARGILRPQDIVDKARSTRSAMHDYFVWDDEEAAEGYRLHQARQLIRACITILPGPRGQPLKVRAYMSLPSDRATGAGYRSTVQIIDDQSMGIEALRMLRAEIIKLKERYATFVQLMPVFARMMDAFPDESSFYGEDGPEPTQPPAQ